MKKLAVIFTLVGAIASQGGAAHAALIAYWNFNALSITTASLPGSGGVPTTISADTGSGSLNLAGFLGTVDDFAGSTLNALGGDAAEESLSLVAAGPAGGPYPGNGSYVDLQVSTSGYVDPIISFATRGTSTGFNTGAWSYSTNGVTFTPLVGNTASISTTFAVATLDMTGVAGVANQPSLTLRYTVSGATSNSGNNRIDNLQLNATPVPEPATMALAGLGILASAVVGRRK
ncbi:PEP-CTERM sorting domain-containing protein [Lacipirellula sp.]|uniref:PEP-CTERM sorting domain-containing protein n=1 Tax=Lacipirellula sp. TaxID=2691419 RepID=UPI003D0FADA0